jgi:hypothetical protein
VLVALDWFDAIDYHIIRAVPKTFSRRPVIFGTPSRSTGAAERHLRTRSSAEIEEEGYPAAEQYITIVPIASCG